jgi:dihydrofolate reductase
MPNIIYIATSIDGYIAREDGNMDWLMKLPNPEKSDYGFSIFLNRLDAMIMGRKTFETILGFSKWPYVRQIPLFVLTNSLDRLPLGLPVKAEIVNGALAGILNSLNGRGLNTIYIDGGVTIQGFLKEDLIDEMTITRIPVLLGTGIPLFDKNALELEFDHVETKIFNNMLVRSKYLRKR